MAATLSAHIEDPGRAQRAGYDVLVYFGNLQLKQAA